MDVTRRTFGAGVLSLGLAGGLGSGLKALELPWNLRLEADLQASLAANPSRAVFSVQGLDVVTGDGLRSQRMIALVRLDWRPGFRQQNFEAFGRTAEEAYAALRDAAFEEFARVVPGMARTDQTA